MKVLYWKRDSYTNLVILLETLLMNTLNQKKARGLVILIAWIRKILVFVAGLVFFMDVLIQMSL